MKKFISQESLEYQKKIAIDMWEFVKGIYITHPDVYYHPAWIKAEFCIDYKNMTGQFIDWKANCILCDKFHDGHCCGCPLDDEDSLHCPDYFRLADPEFPLHRRPSVCDRIIEAIKAFEG